MTVHVSQTGLAASGTRIVAEQAHHLDAREALLDMAFGADRHEKTSERLREGRLAADGLAFAALSGERLVGTVRLWNVTLGPRRPGLLLGPLAVDAAARSDGLGGRLMRAAISSARMLGHQVIVLVGDEPYYRRFGFSTAGMDRLWMPGPVDRDRFLGLELADGALDGAGGLISPTGTMARRAMPELFAFDRIAA